MTGDLDHIFPGVGMGGAKNGCYDFVEDVFSVENGAEMRRMRGNFPQIRTPGKHAGDDLHRIRLSRTKAIAPTPAGVERAAIVSLKVSLIIRSSCFVSWVTGAPLLLSRFAGQFLLLAIFPLLAPPLPVRPSIPDKCSDYEG